MTCPPGRIARLPLAKRSPAWTVALLILAALGCASGEPSSREPQPSAAPAPRASVPPAEGGAAASWVQVREGEQCGLTPPRRQAILAEERTRLREAGLAFDGLDLEASLDLLPPACRPAGGEEALAEAARRVGQSQAEALLREAHCMACGCAQPWFLCVRGAQPAPEALGYLPVR